MDLHVSFLWISDIKDSQTLPVRKKNLLESLLCHVILLFLTLVSVTVFSVWKPSIVPSIHVPCGDYF